MILCAAAVGTVVAEVAGASTSLSIPLGGDVAREARWLGQYGQLACVVLGAAMVWQLDPRRRRTVIPLLVLAMLMTVGTTTVCKHLAGRVRPAYDGAGRFLGPSLERDSTHESFPSGHTSSAVTMTVILSAFYPRLRGMLWTLAVTCGLLRWIRDAHWLGDVLAGAAMGFVLGHLALWAHARLGRRSRVRKSGVTTPANVSRGDSIAAAPVGGVA